MIFKSDKEIEIMKKSGEIVALVHEKLKETISPGVTTKELDKIAEEIIVKNDAEPSFKGYPNPMQRGDYYPASICASINNEVIHGIPDDTVLKEGDIISVDIGACYKGYHGDAARTYAVGEISEEAAKLIKVTRESFYKGIENAVVGNRIVDISTAIQEFVESNGYSVVRDFVGHGIGRDMHEEPAIPNYKTRERGPRIRKGLVLAVEPMVNIGTYNVELLDNKWTVVTKDGSLSAHYENTIVVTESSPIILTKV